MTGTALVSPATRQVIGAVAVSTTALIVAKIGHVALNVIAGLALIRYLGPAGFGDYVFVTSFATLFGLLSDFGLTRVAVRDMSREPANAHVILGTALATRLTLAVLCLGLAQVVLLLTGARGELRAAIAVASLLFVVEALLAVVAVFQVRVAMQYEAIVTLTIQSVDTALILGLIRLDSGLLPLLAAPVASGLVGVVFAFTIVKLRYSTRMSLDPRRVPALLRDALPLGMTSVLVIVYLKADSIFLGVLRGPTDVGLYGAAYRPIEYMLIALAIPANVLFPLLARWHGEDKAAFRAVYRRGAELCMAMALWAAVMLVILADPLVHALYAVEFDPSAAALQLLAIGMVFMLAGVWEGYALLAGHGQIPVLWCNVAGLSVNLVANLILIPRFGFMGAAGAGVLTGLVVAISSGAFAARVLNVWPDWRRLARVGLAVVGVAASVSLALAVGVPWFAAGMIGAAIYPAWLLGVRAVAVSDLRLLWPHGETLSAAQGLPRQ